MLADRSANELLATFFNAFSDGAIYLEVICDAQRQLTSLLIVDGNEKGLKLAVDFFGAKPGKQLLSDNRNQTVRSGPVVEQVAQLLVTDVTQESSFSDSASGRSARLTCSRFGDGVLVLIREVDESAQYKLIGLSQTDLLGGILEASLNGIITYEAIRDYTGGPIVDFRFVRFNSAAQRMLGLSDDTIGKPMLDQLPGVKEAGLFDQFVQVVESGQSNRFETAYPIGDLTLWYDMSVVRLGDGFVITFNDITNSKQAGSRIEQQASFLNSVLDASPNGIVAERAIRDAEGNIIDFVIVSANRQAAEIVHLSIEDLVGHSERELYPGIRETEIFALYVKTIETGEPQFIETHFNNGRLNHWVNISTRKLDDEELVITFSSMSEVKQTQQALEQAVRENKRQAELLNSVLNSSNSGVIAFEAIRSQADGPQPGPIKDFRFLVANKTSTVMLSKSMDEMIGNTLLTVFPGNVQTGLFDLYCRTTETGEPGESETYYNYDGLDFWLEISTQKLGDGFVVTFTDISAQKRAAKIIEDLAAELQAVINTSQTGIFLFSPVRDESGEVVDFRFRIANRQLAHYVGQKPEAVIGALGSTWFPDYITNGLFERYRHTYVTGEQRRFDFHYDGSGIDVWLDIMCTKRGDEVLVTFSDYTPLKRLQQQLEHSVEELQRSNANLEQFAYVASHDLQEPLRKIQAFGDIIQARYAPAIDEQGADMIQRMQSAAARMQVLIKDVLAYSRIATRRESIRPVDLNDLVKDVLNDLDMAIADKKAVVMVGALPTVLGDAPQLRQMFQNLLSNALKFSRPDVTPELTLKGRIVSGRHAGVPIPLTHANRSFHQIEMSDNGIGFEPQYAERIFQVFQRLHGRSEFQGTGIGLAIVQKVVENHQGYVAAEGRPDEGATFRICFPVNKNR